MMVDPGRMFHCGCLVEDVEAAMAVYSNALGVRWAEPVRIEGLQFWQPSRGMVRFDHLLTYSIDGPQHLEIQCGAPGSFYDPALRPGFHVGYWSDDVATSTADLVACGWVVECAALPPEQGYGMYTYLAPPTGGMMVEFVASYFKPRFTAWLAGEPLDVG